MNQAKTYHNAMELLVDKEVRRQAAQLPKNALNSVNLAEVATYALNRLPPLYSSNQDGWRQQKLKGERKLGHQISLAVRQAFVIISREAVLPQTPPKEKPRQESVLPATSRRDLKKTQSLSQRNQMVSVLPSRVSSPGSGKPAAPSYRPASSVSVNVTSQVKPSSVEFEDFWGDSFYLR